MSTDALILSPQRFIAQKSNVRKNWSENGNNFIGAKNELGKVFKRKDHDRFNQFLQLHSGNWKTKPSFSKSHG